MSADGALDRLESRTDGLSESEAAARAVRFGPNALAEEKREGLLRLALRHVANPIIYVLCAAVAISLITGHFIDAAAIFAVIVLNTALGMAQEARAERALDALKELAAPRARVVRDGEPVTVPATEVVPGDILELETGDRVAADARLVSSRDLQCDEAALTGESEPVSKHTGELEPSIELADRKNMVWMSTVVTGGRALAVVVATGMNTTVGNIAEQIRSTTRPKTPLQRRINRLGTVLGCIAVGLGAMLFGVGLLRLPGEPVAELLLFAVAAAVSAVPSGLPAAISVTLALGVRRMASRNAIIRQLPAVETLGSTTVICSDKTGTLTRNEMTVTRVWVAGERYETPVLEADGAARSLLELGALASNARIVGARTDAYKHERKLDGSATEKAILALSLDSGCDLEKLKGANPRLGEIPFSSSRKWMAVLVKTEEGRHRVLLKGAPERVLGRCSHYADRAGKSVPVDEEFHWQVQDAAEHFATDALRLVAGAYRDLPDGQEELTEADVEGDFVFLGLWGMVDPPRDEAAAAVKAAHGAGIRTVMITGDHAATATAIARQIGISGPGRTEVLTGHELDELSEEELSEKVGEVAIFARVSPAHKLRILNALTGRGEVVAMTGDGVNDAPALKAANIGIAMGKSGTEVAKEAGDMILTDDNFATIVSAVEEGRVIFHNIRRVVSYLMGTNFGEMITFASCILLGLNKPLTAVMVLWVNLVTDGACTIPLGLEPGHGDVLSEPPRSPKERLVNAPLTRRVAQLALTMAAVTTLQFFYDTRILGLDPDHARTIAFTTLAAFQWFQAFALRSARRSVFKLSFAGNRWLVLGVGIAVVLQVLVIHTPLGPMVFQTVPLTLAEWGRILALSSTVLIVDEIRKLYGWLRRRGRGRS